MKRKAASRIYSISRPNQIRVLASPVRQEILDVLARMPRASVAALAAALGRPADALYYHLRALERVGLVVRRGERRRRGRSEALYETVTPELSLVYDPGSAANVDGVGRVVASMLRLGVRDFRRAFSSGGVAVSGPRRELWAGRATGWLDGADIGRINRLLKLLFGILGKSRAGRGRRLFAVTYVLVPLDGRLRRRKEFQNAKSSFGPSRSPSRRRPSGRAGKRSRRA
jgi:DNA-binding transcriptional ArsR family regulator